MPCLCQMNTFFCGVHTLVAFTDGFKRDGECMSAWVLMKVRPYLFSLCILICGMGHYVGLSRGAYCLLYKSLDFLKLLVVMNFGL